MYCVNVEKIYGINVDSYLEVCYNTFRGCLVKKYTKSNPNDADLINETV